jgi:flagella basal body P-ring formation protein FlgA
MSVRRTILLIELLLVAGLTISSTQAVECDEALRQTAMRTFALDTAVHQIEVLSSQLTNSDVDLSELTLRPLSQKEPIGLFTVIATITRDGRQIESGQVSLRIRKFADVLVTTDNLRRHDAPAPNKFTLQRTDITSLQEQPVTAFEEIASLRMRRNLAKGQILTTSAVEPVPDIEVGREVAIQCSNGLFTVTTTGTAQQSGSAGDLIRVKNRASGKTIQARILDISTVAIAP